MDHDPARARLAGGDPVGDDVADAIGLLAMHQDDVPGVHLRLHARAGHGHVSRRAAERLRAQEDDPDDDQADETGGAERAPQAPEKLRAAHPNVITSSGVLLAAVRLLNSWMWDASRGDSAESRIRKPLLAPEYIDVTCDVTVHSR